MDHPDLPEEQRYFAALYARLEADIERAERRLAGVRLEAVGGHHQARLERDVFARELEGRIETLRSQRRDDLCFGRIDLTDGTRHYIGRLGLADDDLEPLLIDWRAPAAAPFYQATALNPMGVVRRRHFLTRKRGVVAIEDEVLDAQRLGDDEAGRLRGEAVLHYAMNAARTGRMQEIAATIQREQDEIIRAPLTPAVFVQGGPGTGKTAVALHRAAYLLYTHRRRLTASDVLVVGPNPTFLRYIENVLPSLGESGADLTAVPDVHARRRWEPFDPARVVKSRLEMAEVVRRAVATRERPVTAPVSMVVDDRRVVITRGDTRGVIERFARQARPHNAKAKAVRDRLARLAARRARAAGSEWEFEELLEEIRATIAFRRLVARVWPVLTPEELVAPLFGYPALLREATRGVLSEAEAALLARPVPDDLRTVAWTRADAPILDEAARQLGPVPAEFDRRRRRTDAEDDEEAAAEAYYARETRSRLAASGIAPAFLSGGAGGRSDGRRDDDDEDDDTTTWRYAVIDEAQDLSAMEWRMIGRHCPRRALTVVGDLAQGTEPWAPTSWAGVARAAGIDGEPKVSELTINYRTPAEAAAFAGRILTRIDPALRAPEAIRSVPGSFTTEHVPVDAVAARGAAAAVAARDELGEGIACLIGPDDLLPALRASATAAVGAPVPEPDDPDALDAPLVVMSPRDAKGLEFDVVVVVEPVALAAEAGDRGLYVSVSRATQRLVVVHSTPEPL